MKRVSLATLVALLALSVACDDGEVMTLNMTATAADCGLLEVRAVRAVSVEILGEGNCTLETICTPVTPLIVGDILTALRNMPQPLISSDLDPAQRVRVRLWTQPDCSQLVIGCGEEDIDKSGPSQSSVVTVNCTASMCSTGTTDCDAN